MKGSNATSARASTTAPRPTGRSSDRRPPTPIADGAALTGPSQLPDPDFNAYRKDLADVALTNQVIASHYAEPVKRVVAKACPLRDGPSAEAAEIRSLAPGDAFDMLDDSLGWAWGYAGQDRRVGYVESDALTR
ncbi:MAG: SH3 domain-containing protein [Pseudomonadota bacterium]